MRLLSVIVSHNRLPLLQQTIETYLNTVTVPHDLVVVDNGSDEETRVWLADQTMGSSEWCGFSASLLMENRYPGGATNHGWDVYGMDYHTILHRSDNDIVYLPGWDTTLMETFEQHPEWGQVSLRTDEEELHQDAVGGNAAIRREVWDAGVRFTELPWTEVPWEDGLFNADLRAAGFGWGRVPAPCIVHAGRSFKGDPYAERTYTERGLNLSSLEDPPS